MYALDLFSGIGGISLALKDYAKTVAYCEINKYSQAVLMSRMESGQLDKAPIWGDVCTLRGDMFPAGSINLITAGFPCQDLSVAGRGVGLEGKRSGLYKEVVRLVEEIKPQFVFLENVPAIRKRGMFKVLRDFQQVGYDFRWCILSAENVGAPHKRDRWWGLAKLSDSNSITREPKPIPEISEYQINACRDGKKESVSDTRREQQGEEDKPKRTSIHLTGCSRWEAESSICRVVDGLPYRVDRVKSLGNSVVPACAKKAFEYLIGI